MTTYTINIAKAHTLSDWQGKPAHTHFARVALRDTITEGEALGELARLRDVYPWPTYHLTLRSEVSYTEVTQHASTAPADHLKLLQWNYPSIHKGEDQ